MITGVHAMSEVHELSTFFTSTHSSFKDLLVKAKNFARSNPATINVVAWEDEIGRLRVWAANIGAHQTGQSSLAYRLRDASHISQQVKKLLKDLQKALSDFEVLLDDSRSYQKDLTWVDQLDDQVYDRRVEAQELQEEVANIIDCLYQMSMLVRNPARHSVFATYQPDDGMSFEPYDKSHVAHKFPAAEPTIVSRLALAITSRRRYLRHRSRHHEKLSQGIDSDENAGSSVSETIATKVNLQENKFDDRSSESGFSGTSYSSSLLNDNNPGTSIPSLPKESKRRRPFECPYCFFMVSTYDLRSWARHVFRDLHPYLCPLVECTTPTKMYDRRQDWTDHIASVHGYDRFKHSSNNSSLACPLCSHQEHSIKAIEAHLARHMEGLALFALPIESPDDDGITSDLENVHLGDISDLDPDNEYGDEDVNEREIPFQDPSNSEVKNDSSGENVLDQTEDERQDTLQLPISHRAVTYEAYRSTYSSGYVDEDRGGSRKLCFWICGWCKQGPWKRDTTPACLNCGRRKDQFAAELA